ncbi:SDR family oxidoreductase [Rhodobacteraceae bacterium 2376]|uniref:SDR family oxidoreductase n=1 Tax=Rhabdonatronobacter sediminivivens TaxID=2743469 RepID=A0A7Z0KYF0_9RHOB|nr:SDR family oxidoreductase [Rhabdonatronobacter sediminivivens]NYS25582.1 SDR family oxidoreductase [Rhabdonatronobacter sediminivivens]
MSFSLNGKTAIVTGSANGVGLAIARHFADQGAHVMLADLDEGRLKREVAQFPDHGENTRFFAGDLREKLTVANLMSATVDAFDRIDILVNAIRQCSRADPLDAQDDAVETLLQQNLMASLRVTQAAAKRMIAQGESADTKAHSVGAIVNLTSIAARRSQPELMAYSISTAALDQMTRSMAVALAPKRIRVNAVAIGSVMSANLKDQMREHEDYRDSILKHTPLGRIGAATEAAEAVQFLASDAAGFVTGQIVTVDGGRTLIDPVSAPAH